LLEQSLCAVYTLQLRVVREVVGDLRAMSELAARLNAIDGRVAILAPAILTRMLDMSDLRSLFVVGDPLTTDSAINAGSVVLLAALFAPVFGGVEREHRALHRETVLH
jgi:hypothetical protein